MAPSGSANAETLPAAEPEKSPSKVNLTIEPPAEEAANEAKADAPASSPEPEKAPSDKAEESKSADSDAADSGDELSLAGDQTKTEKETAQLEAAAKKQAELDQLAESREYFLPINSVERRRSKLVTLLGVILIVALGLLLVNMMLDAGFIRIPGVRPLTHFFSV